MINSTIKISFAILTLFLLNSTYSFSQNFKVQGQFTGDQLDKSFINVINTTQYKASISQLDGKFEISAKIGDSILISSIQYKDVKFIVRPEFKTESIEIPLKLKVTELENVDIYSTGLTGDLEKDVKGIKLDESLALNFSLLDLANAYDPEITTQSEFKIRNHALEKNQPNLSPNFDFLMMGKMISNLFDKSKNKRKSNKRTEDIVFTLDDATTLSYYLNIEEQNLEDFMTYAYQHGLDEFLKTYPSEIDLIQFLVELSSEYKKSNASKK